MVLKKQNYFFLCSILLCFSCNKKQIKASHVSYNIVFTIIQGTDSTRIYKPDTDLHDKLHFRPLDIDVWYPAKSTTDSVLVFGDILGLLEQRANVLSAPRTFNGITRDIAKSFCEGFGCSNTDTLLNYPTRSFKDAQVSTGKFPLIIYLASYDAMSYDNYVLLEDLAKQGYVVACVSSVGRYPGTMTMKHADLME